MNIKIQGTNLDLTEALKQHVLDKVSGVTHQNNLAVTAMVELYCDTHHHKGEEKFRCEITMYVPREMIRVEESATDMYAAIDLCVPKLKRQLERYKQKELSKLKNHRPSKEERSNVWSRLFAKKAEAEDLAAEPAITKRKQLVLAETMSEEAAISAMNTLSHDFFIFKSDKTGAVAVVYKRKDGDYGVIESR